MRPSFLLFPLLLLAIAGACAPSIHATHVERPVTFVEHSASDPPPRRPAAERRSRLPGMVAAGAAGAFLGGFLGATACDDLHETDAECDERTVEGALVGAGIGVLLGAAVGR